MTNEPTILESSDIVAFILCTTGIQPKPLFRESDRKVVFLFDEDVSKSIEDFYKNIPVPIADFCKNLRLVRSMIFTLKGSKK